MRRVRHSLVASLLPLLIMWTGAGHAQDLQIRWLNGGGEVAAERSLDLQALDAMQQAEVVTRTPWTKGVRTFSGPLLADLAALAGQPVSSAVVSALNDYSATIPAEDWESHDLVVATRVDGETMRIRNNGPFWIVYPLDEAPELDVQVYHSRMVWQIREISFTLQ